MADIINDALNAAKNIDKGEIKDIVGKALDSDIADKAIDAVEKKVGKDIDKKDIKEGLDKLVG